MKRDKSFEALLEGDLVPEAPRAEYGRTLPFVKARVQLEDIYRLSQEAEKPAALVLKSARAGADELAAALHALNGKPYRGFALLYAAQKAGPLVAEDPRKALALAERLSGEAETLLPASLENRASVPAPRQAVLAEATILRAQCLIQLGEAAASREAISPAREFFREAGDLGFGGALCDYFEGQACSFLRKYEAGEALLTQAIGVLTEFGQDHLAARAESALGTLLGQKGDFAESLEHLDRALRGLDPEHDARQLTMVLNNRATTLLRLGSFDEARASFAKALNLARRHGFAAHVYFVRTGLAELDFRRGQYERALRAFSEIVREQNPLASSAEMLFARLFRAECLGRTGQMSAMVSEIEAIRKARRQSPFAPSPALGELFVCLDQGTLDADLVAYVREYLEDIENGVERAYVPLRLVS